MTALETNTTSGIQTGPPLRRPSVVVHSVSWSGYETLLNQIADQHIRINYDNGELEFMPPLPLHERWKKVIGSLVEVLAVELEIPLGMLGSTTFRSQEVAKGLEPDECYYVQNEPRIRGKMDIDLSVDPPPDLAIEIDITRSSIDREAIYAGLKVPELWRFNVERLEFLRLTETGYAPCERSTAFPMLSCSDLQRILKGWGTVDDATLIREFRNWVRGSGTL